MFSSKHALEPDVAALASLLADPSRALILQALADAQARPAGELARLAGITAQTASGHLSRLVKGRLLITRQQGRHRYYQLRDERVAELLEFLASFAPPSQYRAALPSRPAASLHFVRTCYGHLAGRVGVAVTEALCARKFLREADAGYEVSAGGRNWFSQLGIDVQALPQRPLTRRCLDWSERRSHLGGPLGVALASRLLELHWLLRRREPRALRLTERGRQELRRELFLEFDAAVE